MRDEVILTPAGLEKLRAELAELKGPKRHAASDAIREARSHGDLRENAAYHEAKLNQGRLEGRIADIEKILEVARVVEQADGEDGVAQLGSKIKLLDAKWEEEMTVEIVGSYEADPAEGKVSIDSPMGKALVGKKEGDEAEVEAPAGIQRYKILSVQ
ncbi:MAG TPA: transcription elongation factor GreA [Fimbriimonadales bacterium]|jgi:transcription elongation factor GreA|nr:transcription elongation factor GreA [Fimbriimonadales bacterium]